MLAPYVRLNRGRPGLEEPEALLARVSRNFLGLLRSVDALLEIEDPRTLLARLDEAESRRDGTFLLDDHALLFVIRGRLHEKLDERARAKQLYEHAWALHPHRRNPAFEHLRRLAGASTTPQPARTASRGAAAASSS